MSLFSNEPVLSAGFDIDTPDSFGRTCLHAAAAGGWVAVPVAAVSYFVSSVQIWCQPTSLCHPQRDLLQREGSKVVWCHLGHLRLSFATAFIQGCLQSGGDSFISSAAEAVVWSSLSMGVRHWVKTLPSQAPVKTASALGGAIVSLPRFVCGPQRSLKVQNQQKIIIS